jgi:PAS domain S-box-containing protein
MNEQPLVTGPSISAPAALYVLWVGDAALAQRFTARRAPHVQIVSQNAAVTVELLQGQGERLPDLLVIDATMPGVEPLQLLRLAGSDAVDLPVVLLTQPGQDDLITQAEGLAVCDTVVKTPDFVHQLLPAFSQVRARHDVLAVLRTTRQSEERFRTVLELQPAVMCVIAPDGHIQAMNQAGIGLLATSREQVVGRQFASLLPPDEQEQAQEFITRVCGGEACILEHSLIKADGTVARVRTEAVSLPRAEGNVALATMHERQESASAPDASVADGLAAERDRLAEQLREAADQVDALRADQDGDRAEWAEEAKAADARHLLALQELEAERGRLDQALRDAAAQAAAGQRDAEHEREQLAQALQSATIRCESLAADFYRAENTLRDVQTRQQRDIATVKTLEAERDRLHAELAQAQSERQPAGGNLEAERDRLNEALQALQAQHDAAAAASAAERARWNDERTQWTARAQQAQVEHAALADAISLERDRAVASLQSANARCDTLANQLQQSEAAQHEIEATQTHAGSAKLLAEEREEHARDLQELRLQHDTLVMERDRVGQSLRSATARCEQLSEQLQRAEASLRDLESARTVSRDAEAAAANERDAWTAERQTLETALTEMRAERDALLARVKRTEATLLEIEAERAQAGSVTEQLQDERARHAEQVHTLRADHKSAELRWTEERAQWVERAKQSHDTHMSVVDAIAAERDQLLKKLKSATTRCEALEDAIRHSDSGTKESLGRQAQDADTIHQLSADIRAFAAQRDRLTRELDDARAHHAAFEQAWTIERARWQESNKQVAAEQQAKLDALHQTVQLLQEQRQALKSALAEATTRVETLAAEQHQTRATETTAELENVTRELRDTEARCEHLVTEMGHARTALAQAETQLATQAAEVTEARRRIGALDQIEQRILADQQDLAGLRQELLRFLCDADIRIKSLTERRDVTRHGLAAFRER